MENALVDDIDAVPEKCGQFVAQFARGGKRVTSPGLISHENIDIAVGSKILTDSGAEQAHRPKPIATRNALEGSPRQMRQVRVGSA